MQISEHDLQKTQMRIPFARNDLSLLHKMRQTHLLMRVSVLPGLKVVLPLPHETQKNKTP